MVLQMRTRVLPMELLPGVADGAMLRAERTVGVRPAKTSPV
jgi:hypothetical protein